MATARRSYGWLATAGLVVFVGCAPAATESPQTPLEDEDPMTLTWIAPTPEATIEVSDPVELAVATENPGATVVHFAVDGAEVGVCDPTDAVTGDCLDAGSHAWRWTTQFATTGHHTIVASFTDAQGTVTEVTRELDVLAAGTAPAGDDAAESGATDADPTPADQLVDEGNSQITQGITAARGYLDPTRPWHNQFGGIAWEVLGQRVLVHGGALNGSVHEVAGCMSRYGASIRRYADAHYISRASVVATLIAESNCTDPRGSSDGLSSGPMQVTASTCSAVTGLSYSTCRTRMYNSVDFSIDVGIRYMASGYQVRQHHHDPPKIAAAYNAGSVRSSTRNHWHMLTTGNHIDRWVSAYNAYRTWEDRGSH